MPIILFLITVLSRLPFTSTYLYHLDSGNFALALKEYDLTLHQPHPPGYFLYVMLGRLLNLFIPDPNVSLVLASILFSALAVVVIYHLAKEMYDTRIGTLAALLAVTSPNFWFHGEVALSYTADALFSALIALFCWRSFRGARAYTQASSAVLALSGGFRQNTPVFLFPLWLYSARKASWRTLFVSLALFCVISLAWFLPMAYMTGGIESYLAAFRELWLFNTGHHSVFAKGLDHLKINLLYLHAFIFYSLGAALPFLPLALYAVFRSGNSSLLKDDRAVFLFFWMLPSFLFYLLIFISGNPGYILIIMPPLVILASASLCYITTGLRNITGRDFHYLMLYSLVSINSLLFLCGNLPVSRSDITSHDTEIQALAGHLSRLDHRTTALFISPDSFYSYRHLMVYLPRFTVYQVDVRTGPNGEQRKQFWGKAGRTFLTATITPPRETRYFAAVMDEGPRNHLRVPPRLAAVRVSPHLVIISGPIERVCELFPELRPQWNPGQRVE
jgi:hypothetical protein